MKKTAQDWERISNVNLLRFYLSDIENHRISGRPKKNLVYRGLIRYDRNDRKYHLTPKAENLLKRIKD